MHSNKFFILFLTCLLHIKISALYAQDSLSYALCIIGSTGTETGINIGQRVPAINIPKVFNYKTGCINISDLKGKFVILDFWHQYCTVCLNEFPKLSALQHQFGDSLLILPVTYQSKASVVEFVNKRNTAGKQMILPSIVEDTVLHKLFPHAGNPHEVWIDRYGIVSAITDHLAVTEENLTRWIRTGSINLPLKKDYKDFDFNKPLLVNNNGGADSSFIFRSLFTRYLEGVHGGGYMAVQTETTTRIMIQNQTLESMYKIVYSGADNSPFKDMNDLILRKRMILETGDSSRNDLWTAAYNAGYEQHIDFCRRHLYSYDLILPSKISLNKAYEKAILDIDVFFGITSVIEKRKIKCLALTKVAGREIVPAHGDEETYGIEEENETLHFTNKSISFIVDKINSNYDLPLVMDETGYTQPLDITLICSSNYLTALQDALNFYGFELTEKVYELEVLVLKDNNQNR